MAEFEENEEAIVNNSDNDIEAIIADTESFELTTIKIFMIEVGPANKADVNQMINQLFVRSATHSMLKRHDDIEEASEKPSPTASFLLENRYGSDKFYGVMIDSGAARK